MNVTRINKQHQKNIIPRKLMSHCHRIHYTYIHTILIPSNEMGRSRHLSDSEDDNQDDRSLLCVRDKM